MAADTAVTQPASSLAGACLTEKGILEDDSRNSQSDAGNAYAQPKDSIIVLPPLNGSLVSHHTPSNGLLEHSKKSIVVEFTPTVRSGAWFDIGGKMAMEDEHILIDDLVQHFGSVISEQSSGSYYGVFDGHGGRNAAEFVKDKLLNYIIKDVAFPTAVEEAVHHAFLQTDTAFAEACSINHGLASGTTALTVLVLGRELIVANAGDCRAVLCRKGKAIDMSRDHKASCSLERRRIESLGGFVDDGYLNGQINVARAIGNWHIKGLKGVNCPLSAEPEVRQTLLTEEDEFMIIGCDGFWDVFTSQNAVDFARRKLQQHNDPMQCSKDLVGEALRRDTMDNTTVVTICFQRSPPPQLFTTKFVVRRAISVEGINRIQDQLDTVAQRDQRYV